MFFFKIMFHGHPGRRPLQQFEQDKLAGGAHENGRLFPRSAAARTPPLLRSFDAILQEQLSYFYLISIFPICCKKLSFNCQPKFELPSNLKIPLKFEFGNSMKVRISVRSIYINVQLQGEIVNLEFWTEEVGQQFIV